MNVLNHSVRDIYRTSSTLWKNVEFTTNGGEATEERNSCNVIIP